MRELLEKIPQRGTAILLIEQKLTIARAISNRVYLMGHGRIVFEDSPQALRSNERCASSGWRCSGPSSESCYQSLRKHCRK